MNPSVSQSWTHKHQLSLLPIKPRRRPHTHREGCHVYRLKKLNRKKGDERNRTQFLRQSKCHRQLEKVIITRATSECSSPSKNSENKINFRTKNKKQKKKGKFLRHERPVVCRRFYRIWRDNTMAQHNFMFHQAKCNREKDPTPSIGSVATWRRKIKRKVREREGKIIK